MDCQNLRCMKQSCIILQQSTIQTYSKRSATPRSIQSSKKQMGKRQKQVDQEETKSSDLDPKNPIKSKELGSPNPRISDSTRVTPSMSQLPRAKSPRGARVASGIGSLQVQLAPWVANRTHQWIQQLHKMIQLVISCYITLCFLLLLFFTHQVLICFYSFIFSIFFSLEQNLVPYPITSLIFTNAHGQKHAEQKK